MKLSKRDLLYDCGQNAPSPVPSGDGSIDHAGAKNSQRGQNQANLAAVFSCTAQALPARKTRGVLARSHHLVLWRPAPGTAGAGWDRGSAAAAGTPDTGRAAAAEAAGARTEDGRGAEV